MFDGHLRTVVDKGVKPIGNGLARLGVTPDQLTGLGLVMAVATAVAIGSGHTLLGFFLLVSSALPDLFDGAVAKAAGSASIRGAFFDSTADRVTDALLLGGIGWHLQETKGGRYGMLAFAVLGVSTLISYMRAKAEIYGLDAKGGLMERAERIIVICVGLVIAPLLVPVLWLMLALTSMTAVQRFVKVWRQADRPMTSTRPPARARSNGRVPGDRPGNRRGGAVRPETAAEWVDRWRAERDLVAQQRRQRVQQRRAARAERRSASPLVPRQRDQD